MHVHIFTYPQAPAYINICTDITMYTYKRICWYYIYVYVNYLDMCLDFGNRSFTVFTRTEMYLLPVYDRHMHSCTIHPETPSTGL